MLGEQGAVNAMLGWFGLGPYQMVNNLFGSVVGYLTLVMPLVLLLQLFSLAAAFSFVLAFGDLISPQVLGGSNPPTLSILIVDQVRGGLQWSRAAVIAVVMVATLVGAVSPAMAASYGGKSNSRKGGCR